MREDAAIHPLPQCPSCFSSDKIETSASPQPGDALLIDRLTPQCLGYNRFDVVVLQDPENGVNSAVKRIVGLPGETIDPADPASSLIQSRLVSSKGNTEDGLLAAAADLLFEWPNTPIQLVGLPSDSEHALPSASQQAKLGKPNSQGRAYKPAPFYSAPFDSAPFDLATGSLSDDLPENLGVSRLPERARASAVKFEPFYRTSIQEAGWAPLAVWREGAREYGIFQNREWPGPRGDRFAWAARNGGPTKPLKSASVNDGAAVEFFEELNVDNRGWHIVDVAVLAVNWRDYAIDPAVPMTGEHANLPNATDHTSGRTFYVGLDRCVDSASSHSSQSKLRPSIEIVELNVAVGQADPTHQPQLSWPDAAELDGLQAFPAIWVRSQPSRQTFGRQAAADGRPRAFRPLDWPLSMRQIRPSALESETQSAPKPYTLGPGEFFVIGDNARFSLDSRTWPNGAVNARNLLGRARHFWGMTPEVRGF